jgi:hypothetical protein
MILAVALAGCGFSGCRTAAPMGVPGEYQPAPLGGVDFGEFNRTPRPRIGSLPFPGLLTLFETANPAHLGHHAYDQQKGEPEVDRGIIYTTRGGFIDIAHARKTIDLSKYVAVRAEWALLNNWSAFQVKSIEPSMFLIRLNYPSFWRTLPPDEKQRLARELATRIAQRTAMVMVTWHEILTWSGYQSTPLVSERPSALTWDDTGAHAFGVAVADRALRDPRDWDFAVTDAIQSVLGELGAVSPRQCVDAIDRVKGAWWRDNRPLRRQVEMGWDEPLHAWLVPGLSSDANAIPHRYELPRFDDVLGRDFRGLLDIQIAPNVFNAGSILDAVPGRPKTVNVDRDLPGVLARIRQSYIMDDGPLIRLPQDETPYLAGRHASDRF